MSLSAGPSWVYFVQIGDEGLIKIGTTTFLPARLQTLHTETHAKPLRVLATTPGGRTEELDWHSRFEHLRIFSEWFLPEPDLLDTIAALPPCEYATKSTRCTVATGISEAEREALETIARAKRVALAVVVRWAIEEYIAHHEIAEPGPSWARVAS